MRRNDRLSVALHVLVHMAESPDGAVTSAQIADWVDTHPVVIRRTFAGLRDAGILRSDKGHGGGWRLARASASITLHEVQTALGERIVPLSAREESPGCLVERAVIEAVDDALREAERVLEARLAALTLADLAKDVMRISSATGHSLKGFSHAS